MSPVLEDRLCYTALQTGSYEKAAELMVKHGVEMGASTARRTACRAGRRAEAQTAARVKAAMEDNTPERPKARSKPRPFSLILMMDGWMIRERGTQWGLKPPEALGMRVEWHEVKGAVLFRVEDQARKESGRGMLLRKYTVAWRGDAEEFGRRVYAEVLRRGLNEAGRLFVVADGGVWIWNLAQEHFPQAQGVLDFYHAMEHLHAVGAALFSDSEKARAWVEPLAHQLKHGGEAGVLNNLEDLMKLIPQLGSEEAKIVKREVNYFREHRDHLHYEQVQTEGCPAGSGAMESFCAQLQGRLKGPGKFWGTQGEKDLLALDIAFRNGDWEELWPRDFKQL